MIRQLLPARLKLRLHVLKNTVIDICSGRIFRYPKKTKKNVVFPYYIELSQEIMASKTLEAKINNLTLAGICIQKLIIRPGEILSFWQIVGRPSIKRGFSKSRAIVQGQLEHSTGGGLCQLSGIIYHISLIAGLKIIERHCHSMDIYTEETRFTPLGSDATVAYGYKDLKIQNTLNGQICFTFSISQNKLSARLYSTAKVLKKEIRFVKRTKNTKEIEVLTLSDHQQIATSTYGVFQTANNG